MKKITGILFTFLGMLVTFSCSIEDLFKQPDVEVTGYSLLELPADTAFLEIDMRITNMDKRQVHVADVNYEVVLEGITLPEQHAVLDMDIYPDSTQDMTLPLSMVTSDAIRILAKLDAGQELEYSVTGLFHVDDPAYKLFNLPLIVSGTASVDAGYEDFYEMPTVTLTDISGNFTQNGDDSYVFDFNVSCLVQNNDSRSVTVDEVDYTVNIEGVSTDVHRLSDTYPGGLSLDGNGSDSLTLPVSLTLNAVSGTQLATAVGDGNIDYSVEGIFHAVGVDTLQTDFSLPLYLTGNTSADILSTLFVQPDVQILAYSLLQPPRDTTYMNIEVLVQNRDSRSVVIADITYQADIEGVNSLEESVEIAQVFGSEPLILNLPLTLLTADAIKLLDKLDAGEELSYHVVGTFHIDDPVLNQFNLPINIRGLAEIEVGYEDFYVKPRIIMLDISGDFTDNEQGNKVFDFDVTCMIENMDMRSVLLEDVEYIVNIEGNPSNLHHYSNVYEDPFFIAGSASDTLTLPVVLTLDASSGNQLAEALGDGAIDYDVEGLIHVTQVDGEPLAIQLPLNLSGSAEADIFAKLFIQPTIEVTGYELKELPGDTAYLDIKMLLTNNDTRTAHIYDVEYTVMIDSLSSLPEYVVVDQTIPLDTITLTLPLTLLTEDAIRVLNKLDAGESLDYTVNGTFHMDDPVLRQFDLPIDISGTATVDVGYEDFYQQPEVTVTDIDGTYRINGFTSYTLNFDVNCSIQNMDTRAATIDEIEYTVTIEGTKSSKHYYSNTYTSDYVIAGNATENLNLPVTFNLGISNGAAMVAACADGTINYVVEGIFHVILVDGTTADFTLPLYISGSVPATMVVE